jgi:hypothetical protein
MADGVGERQLLDDVSDRLQLAGFRLTDVRRCAAK